MALLAVPEPDQKPLAELIALPDDKVGSLVDALRASPPTLLLRDLADRVALQVALGVTEVSRLLRILATLQQVRTRESLDLERFTEEVCQAAEETKKPELRPRDGNWGPFKEALKRLLSIDSFYVTARALDVMREHEHVLCEPRVLTDLRPVFDLEERPSSAVIVHTLKIRYHEGRHGPLKEFFVAMSSEDLNNLKAVLDRAKRKESSIRALPGDKAIRWLDRNPD